MAICKVVDFEISNIRSGGIDRIYVTLNLISNKKGFRYKSYWINENDIFNKLSTIQDILEYGLSTAKEKQSNIEVIEYVGDLFKKGYVIFKLPVQGSRFRKDFPFSVVRV